MESSPSPSGGGGTPASRHGGDTAPCSPFSSTSALGINAKSTATLAKARKTLSVCKTCLGSSWVHPGNVAAPFGSEAVGVFSSKAHCTLCVKCKMCTNGKVISRDDSAAENSSAKGSRETLSNSKGLTKKKEAPAKEAPPQMASFDSTAQAVAAVSISRIATPTRPTPKEDYDSDSDNEPEQDHKPKNRQRILPASSNDALAGILKSPPVSPSKQSPSSSKDTIHATATTNSLSSLKRDPAPTITATSPSKSNVNITVSDFYASNSSLADGDIQHPAVNILSMGSGILSRKRDTFVPGTATAAVSDMLANYASGGASLSASFAGPSGAANSSASSSPKHNGASGMILSSSMAAASGDCSNLFGDMVEGEEFPELVDLGVVFGTRANPEAAKSRMIWSARLYESLRKDYLSRPFDEPVFPERPPSDEIKYRILETFDEGRLDSVVYAARDTGSEFISQGDAESLVDALIFPLNQDNSYTEVFLASYRFFLPSSTLLTSLIEWYNVELDPATATPTQQTYFKHRGRRLLRQRAAKVLLTWIKNHWHDFHAEKELLDELCEFVRDLGEVSFGDGQRMTQAIREQRLSWYMTQYIPPFSAKRAPALESSKPWGLLWDPPAFAAQLTLIDHHYFRQLRPDTYLSLLQHRSPRDTLAADECVKVLMDYVGWFRLVSSYIASLVYKEDTVKKRTKAIKRGIKIASACRALNNFNTCFAVMHGLKRAIVARMTAAWDGLAQKHWETVRELEALMDPRGGYVNFWGELKGCVAPLIPFFAAYIHDLLEIHETEPVYVRDLSSSPSTPGYRIVSTDDSPDNDTINFSKFYNLYSIVAEIEVWRSYSYNSVIPEAAAAANDPKADTCAVVLNHMRDWKCVEDSVLDL
ncbi:hypothetical protein HDU98_010359 [Podochytrium sp. JEL0797]|nr:hypothetical protein HDU98_010359 [Podochytrium sp. JEL0797]